MTRHARHSFNSGELTPLIDARSDIDKHDSGCRTLENMIPRIYGPAERRPGTKYIDTCNGVSRVMPFVYSNTIAYILLLEDLRMWFYYDGGRVLDSSGRRLGIDTPYLAADLFGIQYKQSNDVMWLVHGSYAPRKLSRTTATSFSLDSITFTNGPFLTRNDVANADGITLAPSVTTGSGTLTASDDTFTSGNVGSLYYVVQPRVNVSVSGSATTTGVIGSSLLVEGDFTFNTHGTWTATVELQRSIDDATWETYRTWVGAADRNVQFTATEEDDQAYYRINVTSYTSGTVNADLTVNTSTQTGIARITAVASATSASMTVLKDFASTNADVRWAEGCWSTRRGFPKTVTFFEGRCVYAGTTYQPQTIWFSAVDDFEDFDECTKDDSPFSLTLSSGVRNAIQWIDGLEALLVGTSGGEWAVRTGDGSPLTPTNFSAKLQTSYGSKDIQAIPVGDVILMVDFVGRKVREITYTDAKGKYVAPDLTALAEHITYTDPDLSGSGIVNHAFQKNPDMIYWACRADGTLISMTYEREQNVIAWARHPFETGPGVTSAVPAVPATDATYTLSWFSQNGGIFGVPLGDGELLGGLDAGGVAVDVGGGITGLPYTGHPFAAGQAVRIGGTTSYDGLYTLQSSTTANRLDIVHLYAAETFDGTETAVRNITVQAAAGRMKQASDGTLYFGANWNAANTAFIVIVDTDTGTQTWDTLPWPAQAQATGGTVYTLHFTSSDEYLYVLTGDSDLNVTKFDVANNSVVWSFFSVASAPESMGVDANGNCYGTFVHSDRALYKLDASDGSTLTEMTMMGQTVSSDIFGDVGTDVRVDDTLGLLIGAGSMAVSTAKGAAVIAQMYNFAVRTLDDSAGAQILLGDAYDSGGITYTDVIGFGQVVTDGSYIYVMVKDGQTDATTLYKLLWNGSSLTVVTSVSGPTYGVGVFFDLYGNLVVVNKNDSLNTDTFYYYDTDLSLLGNVDNISGSALGLWDPGAGWIWQRGEVAFNGDLGTDGVAAIPAQTITGLGPNSVAVIPGATEDEVWLIVARQIDGVAADTTTRYLEQMQPRNVDDQEDCWFVDSGLALEGADADGIVSGLDHLEGEEVYALVDGAVVPPQTVTDGQVDLGTPVLSKAIVGLPFRYILKPSRFDLTVSGTTMGSLKRFAEAVVSFYKSANVQYGEDVNNLFNVDWRTEEAYGSPPALYTGQFTIVHDGGFRVEDPFILTGNDPLPCVVRAIVPRIETTGR